MKDNCGRPVFANVEITDDEGETTNGYMQQSLFDISQYKQVISFHNARARHHIVEAHEYAKDLKARHSVQIELPFPIPEDIRKAAWINHILQTKANETLRLFPCPSQFPRRKFAQCAFPRDACRPFYSTTSAFSFVSIIAANCRRARRTSRKHRTAK